MFPRRVNVAAVCGMAALVLAVSVPVMAQARPTSHRARPHAPRIFLDVNAGITSMPHTFSQTASVPLNGETESLRVNYGKANAVTFDAGGGVRLSRQFRVHVTYTRASRHGGGDVTADVPHPLFFNQFRTVQGSISGLEHAESAVHADVMWRVPVSSLDVNAFVGPTFVTVQQDLVSSVTVNETYPYDVATFASAPTVRRSKSAVGVNAGVDVATYFTRLVGIGGLVRYSSATAAIDSPVGGQVKVKAGGLEAGGGIRLRF